MQKQIIIINGTGGSGKDTFVEFCSEFTKVTNISSVDKVKEAAKILTDTYGSYLKADMVQLAHHGSWPGTETLYSNINASVVFWPSNADNAKNRYNASDHASLRKAISIAKDVYLASEGTKTIKLPYTVQNNKSAFLSRLGLK